MHFWWRRHLSGADLEAFVLGKAFTREKESRVFEHLTSCPKCLAEY
jgi:hypothetical protein